MAGINDIIDNFDLLEEWEDRYRYLIELGRTLAPLPPEAHNEANKVRGCASQVWIHPRIAGGTFDFEGDSDAMIVKGLIAVLHALYAGLPLSDVAKVDAPAELARLGLNEHLSSQRSNGVRAMVERIRKVAAEAA